jgi:hypothetical protein
VASPQGLDDRLQGDRERSTNSRRGRGIQ